MLIISEGKDNMVVAQAFKLPYARYYSTFLKMAGHCEKKTRRRITCSRVNKHKIVSIIPCLQSHSYVKCPLWKLFYCPSCQMVLLHGNLQCTVKETGHKKDVFQSMTQVVWRKKSNYSQQEWNLCPSGY